MINIFMNTPSWNLGTNTDIDLQRGMRCIEDSMPDVRLCYPKSKLLSLGYNVKKVWRFIARKMGCYPTPTDSDGWVLRHESLYNSMEFCKDKHDIIYAQGILPTNTFEKPVLLDLFYMRPEDVYHRYSERAKENFDRLTEEIMSLAKKPGIYNLRSDYAIGLVEEICPDEAWKFRNLPFLLPSLKSVSIKQIEDKHREAGCTRFLFCGAQANRKGLQTVIDAFLSLRESYRGRCELHVVSALSDGNVSFPECDDIIFYGKQDREATQEIFDKCHVYVMPSQFESFGLTYIEAMAHGLLVIARDYEPQREILDYGKCGILTGINKDDVLENMELALNMTPEERISFAIKAKCRFDEKYCYDAAIKEWKRAIEDCYRQQ